MKKGIIIFTLLLIMPLASSFEEDILFSGSVEDGQKINFVDFGFEFAVPAIGFVSVTYSDFTEESAITVRVKEDRCESLNDLLICAGSIGLFYRNATDTVGYRKAPVSISIIRGFEIRRTFDKTKLLIDEPSRVEVILENTGRRATKNIDYKDPYPSPIVVTSVRGCSWINREIWWHGSLEPNTRAVCSYILKGKKEAEYLTNPQVTYFYAHEGFNVSFEEVKIEVDDYYLAVQPEVNFTGELGQLANISFFIKNRHPEQKMSEIFLRILVPPHLTLIRTDSGIFADGVLVISLGTLKSFEHKSVHITFLARETGNITLKVQEKYKIKNLRRNIPSEIPLNISCNCPTLNTLLFNISGGRKGLKVILFNPSFVDYFRDLHVRISNNILDQNFTTVYGYYLEPRKSIVLFNEELPEGKKEYYYNVTIAYTSLFGEHFEEKKGLMIVPDAGSS